MATVINGELRAASQIERARLKADLSELMLLSNKLNIKQFGWPVHQRKKKYRSMNISYTQGHVLWARYQLQPEFMLINDKIEFILKQLIN